MTNASVISLMTLGAFAVVATAMWVFPQYSVWQQEMSGKAALAKATQSRQIKVEEAKALKESAGYYAEAEIVRARGVKKSNDIIADGLKGNTEYLRYLWIQTLDNKENISTIYIPVGNDGIPFMKEVK